TDSTVAILTVTQPLLSGRVLEGSNGLGGVTIMIGSNATLTTAADGTFNTNLPSGTYSVTPSRANYTFEPETVSVVLPPSTNLIFIAFPSFTISGRVFEGSNGLSGVTVTVDTNSAVSDVNGNYTISGVRAGDYFVFASLAGYRFSPAREVIVGPNATNVNFYVSNRVFTIS